MFGDMSIHLAFIRLSCPEVNFGNWEGKAFSI